MIEKSGTSLATLIAQPPTDDVAPLLRAWREQERLSQSEAAERLCVSVRTLQGWELGRPMANPRLLRVAIEGNMDAESQHCAQTLRHVAQYVKKHGRYFARSGPRVLDEAEFERRRKRAADLAARMEQLADDARFNAVQYRDFGAILDELRKIGFSVENALVYAVARAFVAGGRSGG
jgi:transcriptional regulator with XRE-family HTH domain